MRMTIGTGKDNCHNLQVATAIPRLTTPSADTPPASSSTSLISNISGHRGGSAAVVTPDGQGHGRRPTPSSSYSSQPRPDPPPLPRSLAASAAGMNTINNVFFPPHERDSATATTATVSSGGHPRRRQRPGANNNGDLSTSTAGNAVVCEGSTGSRTKNRISTDDAGAGPVVVGRRATVDSNGGEHHNQDTPISLEEERNVPGGAIIIRAADRDEASTEEEIKNDDGDNVVKGGPSLLVVQETTRYVTNPPPTSNTSPPPPLHNHNNNDRSDRNVNVTGNTLGSSSRSRAGRAAMSRFAPGKSKGSSLPSAPTMNMMPKTSKLGRKKKTTTTTTATFGKGAGDNMGGHIKGSVQGKTATHKNEGNTTPINLLQEAAGGGTGPQGLSMNGENHRRATLTATPTNAGGAADQDICKNAPPVPSSGADNAAVQRNGGNHDNHRAKSENVAASPEKNGDVSHHPHLYAEINIPASSKKLSKRQSSAKSSSSANDTSMSAGGGRASDVSLAMTSISSLTGRSSIFALPATEGGMGMGMMMGAGIENMYASMMPSAWRTPHGGGAGVPDDDAARLGHPYREENYFDYDDHDGPGDGGRLGREVTNAAGNPDSRNDVNDAEDGIMDKMKYVLNEGFKSTCRCFDVVAAGDGEPLWGAGQGGTGEHYEGAAGDKPMTLENEVAKNNDAAASGGCAVTTTNFSKPSKSCATNSVPPTFSAPMDI